MRAPLPFLLSLILSAAPAAAQTRAQIPVVTLPGVPVVAGPVASVGPLATALPGSGLALPAPVLTPVAQPGAWRDVAVLPAAAAPKGRLAAARGALAAASGRLAEPIRMSGRDGPLAKAGDGWRRFFDGGEGSGDGSAGAPRRDIVELRELQDNGGQAPSNAVYRQGSWAAVRRAAAEDSDFDDVYAVRTAVDPAALAEVGDVLAGVTGEFAIVRVREERIPELLERLHAAGPHHGALVRLGGERLRPAAAAPKPAIPLDQRVGIAEAAVARVDAAKIRARVEELAAIHTRWYKSATGKGVAEGLAKHYRALAAGRTDVEVVVDDHGGRLPQPSLIVRIVGRTRPEEIVVLGGHIDSTARDRAPGADDDASGTAVNLEVFRTLMEQGAVFDRTIEFHGYAAEEAGLLGSRDIARRYAQAGKKVVAMLQNDMNLWKREGAPDKIWFVTDDTSAELNAMLTGLAKRYAGVETGSGRLWGGTSDHLSWTRAGYASSFPFEDPDDHNPRIHTEGDTVDGLSFSQAAAFAKLGIAFAAHFGGASPAKAPASASGRRARRARRA